MDPADVSEQVDHERHTQYVEKVAALGSFAVGLAHELNNPISVILSRIELMIMEGEEDHNPELLADLRVLHHHSQRLTRIAQALLSFGRQRQPDRAPIDLGPVVRDTLLLAGSQLSRKGIHIDAALDPSLPRIFGDPTTLQQVLLILLLTVGDAMPNGGTIRIETSVLVALDRPDAIRLVVSAHAIPGSLFPTPDGAALGLAATYAIVRDLGGTVDVRSEPGGGTTFAFVFPAAERAVK
jgi:signal transduction histidine kinase